MSKCELCGTKPVVGRGLCRKHYQAAWKAGEIKSRKLKSDILTPRTRLMAKIKVTPSGCWEWTGHRRVDDSFEYGLIWVDGRSVRTHRLSYELHKGPIPKGLDILHECDNPPCINPDHLFVGTRGENCQDCGNKNRYPLNEKHWNTKLTVEDVLEIRKSKLSQAFLSGRYGVSQSTISRIRTGKRRQKT